MVRNEQLPKAPEAPKGNQVIEVEITNNLINNKLNFIIQQNEEILKIIKKV